MKEKILELGRVITQAKSILLINHIRMDLDAYGSLAGLYHILKKSGSDVKAINDELPLNDFSFLGSNAIFEIDLNIKKYNPDLIISLDAGSIEQLGEIYKLNKDIFEKTNFAVIDHHLTNTGFGDLNIIDASASSTSEIVFEILEITGFIKHIDEQIATLLIAGLLADTNIYYNRNCSSKTLYIGARLQEYGANSRKVMYEFYKKKEFNKSRLWGEALAKLEKNDRGDIFWTIIYSNTFVKTNTTDKDCSGLINEFLSNLDGMELCFLLYPMPGNKIKASFRSKDFNVGKFCEQFGGGGHRQAAGFTIEYEEIKGEKKELEILKDNILNKLKKELI